jgi:hypothetical protein
MVVHILHNKHEPVYLLWTVYEMKLCFNHFDQENEKNLILFYFKIISIHFIFIEINWTLDGNSYWSQCNSDQLLTISFLKKDGYI